MSARRFLAPIVVGAILAAGCTGESTIDGPTSTDVTGPSAGDPPTPSETTPSETTTSETATSDDAAPEPTTETCRRSVVVDEYGFPIEIEECGSADSNGLDPHAEVATLPAGSARDGLGAALRAAEQLGGDCHAPARWAELATSTADGLTEVATTVAEQADSDPAIGDWIGTPGAYAVLDRIVTDATGSTCEPDEIGFGTDPAAVASAGRLAGGIDDLSAVLDVVDNLGIAGEFWYHSDEVGHTIDLLESDASTIDVLVIGPSTVKRGIDTGELSRRTGRRAYNAAVGALAVDLQRSWYESIRALGVEPETVVVGLNTWIEMEACPDPQRSRMLATDARRLAAFAAVDGVAPLDPARRLAGGDEPTYSSRLLATFRAQWRPGGEGLDTVTDTDEPDVRALQTEQFLAQPVTELCPARLERTQQLLARIAADVPELVVVVLPTSDEMAALHPDGRPAHDSIVERYEAMTAAVGGRFVDRSDAAPDDRFVDLTHLGATGRAELTADLAVELGGEPLR